MYSCCRIPEADNDLISRSSKIFSADIAVQLHTTINEMIHRVGCIIYRMIYIG